MREALQAFLALLIAGGVAVYADSLVTDNAVQGLVRPDTCVSRAVSDLTPADDNVDTVDVTAIDQMAGNPAVRACAVTDPLQWEGTGNEQWLPLLREYMNGDTDTAVSPG